MRIKTMASTIRDLSGPNTASIVDLYNQVRARTMEIVAPLEIEDYVIQTAEFMSPPRWHIGHTSWFFETVLQAYKPGLSASTPKIFFSTSTRITRGLENASSGRSAARSRDRRSRKLSLIAITSTSRCFVSRCFGQRAKRGDGAVACAAWSRTRNAAPGVACLRYQTSLVRPVCRPGEAAARSDQQS